MRRSALLDHVAVAAIAAAVLALAVLTRPGDEERGTALIRDGRIGPALAATTTTLADADAKTLLQHAELLRQGGQFEDMLGALEAAAARHPDDAEVQGRLLTALQELGSETRMLEVARRLAEERGNPEALRVALAELRRRGDLPGELRLLRQAAFTATASMAALERLGAIEASLGRNGEAIQALSDADASRAGITRAGQLTLLGLLLEGGSLKEAERRAVRWTLSQPRAASGPAAFCAAFAAAGHLQTALRVLDRVEAATTAAAAACFDILLASQHREVALTILTELGDRRPRDCALSRTLAEAADRAGARPLAAQWTEAAGVCDSLPTR